MLSTRKITLILDLPEYAIRQQLTSRVESFEQSLKGYFGIGWAQVQTEEKMGLLSMTFASGFGNMLGKYHHILQAARKQQWIKILQETSSRELFLPKASPDRAQWTRELFAAAVSFEQLEQRGVSV